MAKQKKDGKRIKEMVFHIKGFLKLPVEDTTTLEETLKVIRENGEAMVYDVEAIRED